MTERLWSRGFQVLNATVSNDRQILRYDLIALTYVIIRHTLNTIDLVFKVAQHSFRARFCWCNLARAQGFQKTNKHTVISTHTRTICVIFLYNWTHCIYGFSRLLQRYVRKGNDAQNPAIFSFENPIKCNACAVARKIETDCFRINVPISNDPVVRISRNLAKNRSESTWKIYHKKSEFWRTWREFLIIQKTINGELRKSLMSKFY